MKIKPLPIIAEKYVRNSIRAYLEGEQGLRWISGIVQHSGVSIERTRTIFGSLIGYGLSERYQALAQWFDSTS